MLPEKKRNSLRKIQTAVEKYKTARDRFKQIADQIEQIRAALEPVLAEIRNKVSHGNGLDGPFLDRDHSIPLGIPPIIIGKNMGREELKQTLGEIQQRLVELTTEAESIILELKGKLAHLENLSEKNKEIIG